VRAVLLALTVAGACTAKGTAQLALHAAADSAHLELSDSCNERCLDREYTNRHSAPELGQLAVWRAQRGNCTCGYALTIACGRKDPAVRERVVHDPALRGCVAELPPAALVSLRHDATQPGVIAACIGDE
jgi:hypothetical protein